MDKPKAVFIGYQDTLDSLPMALFNVSWPGNELDGSTVSVKTIVRLGLTSLETKEGVKLNAMPLPK